MKKFKFRKRRNSFKKIEHLAKAVFNNRQIFIFSKNDAVRFGLSRFSSILENPFWSHR